MLHLGRCSQVFSIRKPLTKNSLYPKEAIKTVYDQHGFVVSKSIATLIICVSLFYSDFTTWQKVAQII